MTRKSWIAHFGYAAIFLSGLGNNVGAETVNAESQFMKFSYATNGAADGSINKYGNNEVSVSGDVLRVQIGDSDGNRNISGVGIYELNLNGENLESARQMAELLCSPKDPKSDVTLPDLYIAKCGGEMRSSYMTDFSRPVAIKIGDLVEKLTNAGVLDGRKIVKLEISLVSIDREKDGFLVSVRFTNGGDYPIRFKTPDKWDARMGKDSLGVSDSKSGTGAKFGLGLAGQTLVDPAQFPDGEVNLAPHSDVVLKMKTNNIDKFSAGSYDLYAGAFMSMEVTGIQSSLLYVDFHSDYKTPTRVTFDRDYPSTPEEREQWEKMRRAEMSWQPVKPGETFAEDGLYRAVRTNASTHRSLQLVPFKAGDVATTDNVKMLMASASGTELNGPVQWLWEGSAPTPVKQWSFDMIEATRQFCKPDSECPRSGRWLARIHSGSFSGGLYRYDLAGIVTVRQGQTMPGRDDGAEWEWLGV
ncbi:hypothetical protein WT26_22185 [Burkholderia cepacia]|uniref:Uncharacterized protein n=2 Tax=Burkholderia cepacia complex TaxID=87882 RepID=A0A1B4PXR0_BURCE|nr:MULTISPECIES: hypothetical protein [Burkholderia cepacia complex]AOK18721.1 hypothetical protein WT26_22185 [Burkholderia cepacia]AOK25475.1 hypothetical protein WK67_22100 [Burkholderia ubonensis]